MDKETLDLVNAGFETVGGILTWMNARALWRDREVKGVFWPAWAFFAAWGVFNLWFYPTFGAVYSFYAGIFLVSGNVAWIILALWFLYGPGRQRAPAHPETPEAAVADVRTPWPAAHYTRGDSLEAAAHLLASGTWETPTVLRQRLHLAGDGHPWQLRGDPGLSEAALLAVAGATLAHRADTLHADLADGGRGATAYLALLIERLGEAVREAHPTQHIAPEIAGIVLLLAAAQAAGDATQQRAA